MHRIDALSPDDFGTVLRAYRHWVVPGDRWPKIHLKLRWGWRAAKHPRTGEAALLNDYYAHRHLAGRLTVAAKWEQGDDFLVRFGVIDIDADRKIRSRMRVPFKRRLQQVRTALRGISHLLLRSSSSYGVHVYIFLDRPYSARLVRGALRGLLEGADLRLAPGEIEIWPSPHALRLPLGRGSCILDHKLRPLHARQDAAGRLLRDVVGSIVYLDKFADENQVSLRALQEAAGITVARAGVTHERSNEVYVAAPEPTRSPRGERTSNKRANSYRERVAAAQRGISAHGQRYDEASLMVWDLRIAQGLPADAAMPRFEEWLDRGNHHSHDLERDPIGTRARMKRDAERYLAHLDRRIAAGELIPGRGGTGIGTISLLRVVCQTRADHQAEWRAAARARLTRHDHLFLKAKVRDPWLRDHLAVLVGLLRIALTGRPATALVSMHRTALVAIAGGRRRPARAPRRVQRKLGVSAYVALLRAAQRHGLVELVSGYRVGVTARQFRVALPSKPRKECSE